MPRIAVMFSLCAALAGCTPVQGAGEVQPAHLALKADARALEDRARAAAEAIAAGRSPAVSGLARDLGDIAARSRRLAGEAAPGSYLRDHLNETAADLERLAERLERASGPGETESILEEAVNTLFWGFRG